MNKTENKLVPELRFPQFLNDEGWKKVTISDIAKVNTGNKDTQNKVENGQYPFFVRSQTVENINSFSYDGEAILTSGDGVGVGKNFHYIEGKFDYHQRVYCIYDFKDEVIGKFIFMYFSKHFDDRVRRMSAKNSVDSVRMAMITEMPLNLPEKQEQQKIADCLSSLDQIIISHDDKLEALKNHKKGLLQHLFPQEGETVPKFRFPEFENDEDWNVKKLGEILIEGKLGGNYENRENNKGVPIIKMGNIDRGKINLDKIQYLPKDISYNNDDVLKEGDLLFNTRNTLELVGKVAIWRNELPFALYNSNLMRMTFDKKYIDSNFFMNYIFNTETGIKKLKSIATGTTSVAAIYTKDLYTIEVSFPSKKEQKSITECLSTLDNLIISQINKIEQLKDHKKGLMQRLFPQIA